MEAQNQYRVKNSINEFFSQVFNCNTISIIIAKEKKKNIKRQLKFNRFWRFIQDSNQTVIFHVSILLCGITLY